MNNLNSRQERKKKEKKKTEKKFSTTRKRKEDKQLDGILKIVMVNRLNHRFDNEVEHFLVLNGHFQVEV